MIVQCPKCGARNRIPDADTKQTNYLCGRCKATFSISPTAPSKEPRAVVDDQVLTRDRKTSKVAGAIFLSLIIAMLVALGSWALVSHIKDISSKSEGTLNIVKSSDSILRQVAEPVNIGDIGEEERQLATSMTRTIEKASCYGLAGPQVGVSKRIIAVSLEEALSQEAIVVMLNPEIVKQEGNVSGLEWSISVPGSRERPIRITRSEHIVVKYWTLEGTETVLEETGSNARIIQQEIDNLNGILITDYASSFNITPPVLSAIAIVLIVLLLWTRTSLLDDTAKSVGIGRTSVLIGQVYRAPRKYGKYISGSPFVAFLYLMGIIVAEVYVCLLESTLGVVFCSVILVILIIHIQRASEYNTKKFLMSLLLVPISLLIVAFIPSIGHILDRSGNLTNLAIYGVILLAAAVAIIRIAKLAQQDLYLSLGKLRIQLLIGLTGAIIGPALYFLYRPEPLVTEGGWLIQSAALFFIIVAAAAEELVYRGILQSTSTHVLGRWGPIYISIAFAFIHLGNISGVNLSIVSIPFIFIVALFYSWAVGKTRSLLGVTLSHVICNVILWMVLAPM